MRLAALATHIPAGRIEIGDIVTAAGGNRAEAQVFRRLFGIEQVAAVPEGETLPDQLSRIVEGLSRHHSGEAPDAVIHVHGQPFQAAQSPLPALRHRHPFLRGLRRAYEVDQHNCSGFFWALDLARTLLQGGLARSVLLLGGDSHIGLPMADRYVPGCTMMGDAFCGMLVDLQPGGHRLGPVTLHTHPEFARGRVGTTAEMGAFFAAHGQMVAHALEAAGFDWPGNTLLLAHNVNRLAWEMFCRAQGVAPSRVRLDLLPEVGHCYVCDPFLLLDTVLAEGLPPGAAPMLTSVGMGGYVGAARLTADPTVAMIPPSAEARRPAPGPQSPALSSKEYAS